MPCEACGNGERHPARRPYVQQKDARLAVVTDVPVEECAACGETWFDEQVALTLDTLLTEMLSADTVAIRPYPQPASTAA